MILPQVLGGYTAREAYDEVTELHESRGERCIQAICTRAREQRKKEEAEAPASPTYARAPPPRRCLRACSSWSVSPEVQVAVVRSGQWLWLGCGAGASAYASPMHMRMHMRCATFKWS